jgi:hypothetical protein
MSENEVTQQLTQEQQQAVEEHKKKAAAKTWKRWTWAIIITLCVIVLGFGVMGGIYLFKPSLMPSFISNTSAIIDGKTGDFITEDRVNEILDERMEPWLTDTTPTIALRNAEVSGWPVFTTMVQHPEQPSSVVYRNVGPMVELAYIINLRNNTTANITATSYIHVILELPVPIACSTLYQLIACSTNVAIFSYNQGIGVTISKTQTKTRDFVPGTNNQYCSTIYWDIGLPSNPGIYSVHLAGVLNYPRVPPPPPAKISNPQQKVNKRETKPKFISRSRYYSNTTAAAAEEEELPID